MVIANDSAFAGTLFDRLSGKPSQLFTVGISLLFIVQALDTLFVWILNEELELLNVRVQTLPVFLMILVFYVRGSENDLTTIGQNFSNLPITQLKQNLAIKSPIQKLILIVLGIAFPLTVSLAGIQVLNPQARFSTVLLFYFETLTRPEDIGTGLLRYYRLLISFGWGIIWVYLVYFVWTVTRAFDHCAKNIPIVLFQNNLLAPFARPWLRSLLLIAVLFSLLAYQAAISSFNNEMVTRVFLPFVAFFSVLFLVSGKPLLTLRNRINNLKIHEIYCVNTAIAGDMTAMPDAQYHKQLQNASFLDLLNYRDKVEDLWDWPLQIHIKRIVLSVIAPPITWVLSAIVAQWVG